MAYKCEECGYVFDECVELKEDNGEVFRVCPRCHGVPHEAYYCKKCGQPYLLSELHWGEYCDDCLKDAITVDSFLDFATERPKYGSWPETINTLEDFIFYTFFKTIPPTQSSLELKDFCEDFYRQKAKEDFGKELDGLILTYFDDFPWEKSEFANWLSKQNKKKVNA